MKITGLLKMIFTAKLESIAYLQKYDFDNMEYRVDKVSDIDNLIRFLIFRDLEKDTTGTLIEIINSYINNSYSTHNPMFFCYKLFKFLDYIPDVNTFINVLLNSDEIYNYIKNNLKSFLNLKTNNEFCDNLFAAYQIIDFNRRKDIPNEIRYLYENVKHTKLLTNKEELEYTKKYVETRDIKYRNALIEHYQRLIFDKIIIYHNLYHLSYEELIDLGNRVLFDTINTYNLNYPCSLSNAIRTRLKKYIDYLIARKSKIQDNSYLIKENVPEVKDAIEDAIEDLDKEFDIKYLEPLILSIPFTDQEIYFLLYGYGLCGFSKMTWSNIAKNLGVSHSYVSKDLNNRVLRKLKKAIISESLKTKKILKEREESFSKMQSNSIKRFFGNVIELNDEGIFDIERELTNLIREDKTAKEILMKRYNRYELSFDDSLLVTLIVGYAYEFTPLTKEEYKYLFETIIPTIKERLNNKVSQTLKLKA